MSNNDNYIKLPCLKSISVNNYALFKENWIYEVKNGLNLFLGANSLGKTTTANLIIYGIVGIWEEREVNTRGNEVVVDKLSEDYFSAKEHKEQRKRLGDATPSIIIEFYIDSTHIKVRRNLAPLEIVEFHINGNEIKPNKNSSLKEIYKDEIQKLCSLDSINDLSFLMRKLMVREEEGNSLLWDSDDQSKVIQLLFNPPGFFDKYKDVQKQASEASSKANRNRDLKAPFKTKRDVLKEEKEKEIQRIVGDSNHLEINRKYEELNRTINALKESKGRIHEDIEYLNREIRSLEEKYNGLSSDLEITREEIIQLEYNYFDSIYQDPRISLIYNKIDQRNSCIFCKNHINDDVREQIINAVKHNSCPVCRNSLTKEINAVLEIPGGIVDKIESLRQQSLQKEMELNKVLSLKENLENDLSGKWDEQRVMEKQLSTGKFELNELKLVLEQLKKDYEPTNQYDKAIKSYEEDIERFNLIIVEQDKIFKKKKKKLTSINNELNRRIDSLTTKLSNIFNKYSKHFYFKNLQLIPYEGRKSRIDSKVRLTSFRPIFEGKEREHQQSVSKSEGILLEYIFRMSLIKLYHALTNVQPFLILESSEGSFDIVRTGQLANVLKKFSENTFPFISITNLSKPDFVKSIINKLKSPKDKADDYKKRLLNFIDVGLHDELPDKQKILEKEKYTVALKELGL